MKRVLAAFLVLLMLTPALVCVMPICADAAAPQVKMPHNCHSGDMDHNKGPGKITLVNDCMGVDLQVADNHDLAKQVDLQKAPVVFAASYDLSAPDQNLALARNIHGPPPWVDIVSTSYPPVYLHTQRLRI